MRKQNSPAQPNSRKQVKVLPSNELLAVSAYALKHLSTHHLAFSPAGAHSEQGEKADVRVVDNMKDTISELLL
jgi:hypothetical protein